MTIRKRANEPTVQIKGQGVIPTLSKTAKNAAQNLDGFTNFDDAMNRGRGSLFIDFETEAQASEAASTLRDTMIL
jgi:hypothetical protein